MIDEDARGCRPPGATLPLTESSLARLDKLADLLGVPTSQFFEGHAFKSFLQLAEANDLMAAFARIEDPGRRKQVVQLAQKLAS